jgi:hypothetical protein
MEPVSTGAGIGGLNRGRLLLGFIFAPPVPVLLYFFAMIFVSGYTLQGAGHMEKLVDLVLGFLLLSYAASLILGGLILLVLSIFKKLATRYVLGLSALAGFLAGAGFKSLISWPDLTEIGKTAWAFGLIGTFCALVISAVFCPIAGFLSRAPSVAAS